MISVQYTREHASTYALIAGVTRVLCAVWGGSDAVAVRRGCGGWARAQSAEPFTHLSQSCYTTSTDICVSQYVRVMHTSLFPPPLPPPPFSESE